MLIHNSASVHNALELNNKIDLQSKVEQNFQFSTTWNFGKVSSDFDNYTKSHHSESLVLLMSSNNI